MTTSPHFGFYPECFMLPTLFVFNGSGIFKEAFYHSGVVHPLCGCACCDEDRDLSMGSKLKLGIPLQKAITSVLRKQVMYEG